MLDYYAMLGVPRFSSTQEEIRKAFIEQVKFFHPDAGNVSPEIAKEKTQQLNLAYSVLCDPIKKREYDEKLTYYILSAKDELEKKKGYSTNNRVCYEREDSSQCKSRKKNTSVIKTDFAIITLVCITIVGNVVNELFFKKEHPSNVSNIEKAQQESVVQQYHPAVPVRNGEIIKKTAYEKLAPLEVDTKVGSNYYIFLLPADGDENGKMSFYVSGGSQCEVLVPLDVYEIYYAVGSTWLGEKYYFGEETRFYRCDELFEFYNDGESYCGWTIELYAQYNGNMGTESIAEGDFPF